MPNQLTLLDVAKAKSTAAELALVESVATAAPELARFPSRVINGTSFKTLDRSALPTTGFRNANEGLSVSKSNFTMRTHECMIFGGAVNVDEAAAAAWNASRGAGNYEAIEANGVARSAAINIGKQIWYGTDADAKGFPGARAIWSAFSSALTASGQTTLGVDATGTSANAATSVYAVKFGTEFCEIIFGMNRVLSLPPFMRQSLFDAEGKQYPGMTSNLQSWVGLSCANPFSIGRIYNLTAQSGKGLTDALLAKLLHKFPVGFVPDAFFMSRQSLEQLEIDRASRVTLQNGGRNAGAEVYVDAVTNFRGIPIIATDSILNTEAIVS